MLKLKLMKNVKIIDILPTICGAITVLDFIVFNGSLFAGFQPITWAFAITPALAAVSLLTAVLQHRTSNLLFALNILWLVAGIAVVAFFVYLQLGHPFN